MPTFRNDIDSIGVYIPGKPIEDVMREYGLTDIVKLASNECPEEPFAPVQEAITAAATESHRYPDTMAHTLSTALAEHHSIDRDNILVGPGSSPILMATAQAVGGEGTSAVFAENSFLLYSIITRMGRAEAIQVPLDSEIRHDADALIAAVRDDTTVLYVCNPNNPTGTYIAPEDIDRIIAKVPGRVLVVLDEAYEEYVTAPGHRSALPNALTYDNVVVMRTFSKIYGIAGLRVGYAVGQPDTIMQLRRFQAPFAIANVSLAGALEALRHQDLVADRAKANARGRDQLAAGLDELGVAHVPSETNFILILIRPETSAVELTESMLQRGVIVRPFGDYIRVTVGTEAENVRFLETIGDLI
ncbi:MAG: histidinol-phosphate transaminase [Acidimicrobiia bacterium]|nr:histidinol-phosphate transaminase [Acidimicrobiia bacterium]